MRGGEGEVKSGRYREMERQRYRIEIQKKKTWTTFHIKLVSLGPLIKWSKVCVCVCSVWPCNAAVNLPIYNKRARGEETRGVGRRGGEGTVVSQFHFGLYRSVRPSSPR